MILNHNLSWVCYAKDVGGDFIFPFKVKWLFPGFKMSAPLCMILVF